MKWKVFIKQNVLIGTQFFVCITSFKWAENRLNWLRTTDGCTHPLPKKMWTQSAYSSVKTDMHWSDDSQPKWIWQKFLSLDTEWTFAHATRVFFVCSAFVNDGTIGKMRWSLSQMGIIEGCRSQIFSNTSWRVMKAGSISLIHFWSRRVRRGRHKYHQESKKCGENHRQTMMLIAFFDYQGLVYLLFVPANVTVNSEHYCGVLKTLCTYIAKKQPDMKQSWHLHHHNARPHTSRFTNAFLEKFNIQCISHPAYSPDLAPCDFWLFSKQKKKTLHGQRFRIVQDMKTAI